MVSVGMRYIQFDPVDYAKTALVPLADELIACADAAGSAEQQLYFGAIRAGLATATNAGDLIEVFFNLSAANFMGFDYTPETALVLDRLLEKSELLAEAQGSRSRNRSPLTGKRPNIAAVDTDSCSGFRRHCRRSTAARKPRAAYMVG